MSEKRVREEAPDLYAAIAPWIPLLPDFRPQETLRRMRSEPQTIEMNWRLIEMELEALNIKSRKNDAKLMTAIFSGDRSIVLDFLDKRQF